MFCTYLNCCVLGVFHSVTCVGDLEVAKFLGPISEKPSGLTSQSFTTGAVHSLKHHSFQS